jgi:hypothetical protein
LIKEREKIEKKLNKNYLRVESEEYIPRMNIINSEMKNSGNKSPSKKP